MTFDSGLKKQNESLFKFNVNDNQIASTQLHFIDKNIVMDSFGTPYKKSERKVSADSSKLMTTIKKQVPKNDSIEDSQVINDEFNPTE